MFEFSSLEKKTIERQDGFRSERENICISDSDFLNAICPNVTPREKKIVLLLRKFIAESCNLEPEKLSPDDSTAILDKMMFASCGFLGFHDDTFMTYIMSVIDKHFNKHTKFNWKKINEIFLFAIKKDWSIEEKKCLGEWAIRSAHLIDSEIFKK